MSCSSSCPTQDHASWGECVKSKGLRVGWAAEHKGIDLTREKRWEADLAHYKNATAQGIQPEGTQRHQVDAAIKASESTGIAFNAEVHA